MSTQNIVRNNNCVTKLLKFLKSSEKQYKLLNKKEERHLIDTMVSQGKEEELRKLLVMHNIRFVFSIAKKYCKCTNDYDNMVAKGLYGLVYASNKFNLHMPIMVKDKDTNTEVPKIGKNGEQEYIKFCTYAKNWIFKYIVQEFDDKTLKFIDNYSMSLDDTIRIKNSMDTNQTLENYINDMISVDYRKPKTIDEELSANDVSDFYSNIQNYLNNTNDLTSMEKKIIIEAFYNNKKLSDIAKEMNISPQIVMMKKNSTLKKLREYVQDNMNIHSVSDFVS